MKMKVRPKHLLPDKISELSDASLAASDDTEAMLNYLRVKESNGLGINIVSKEFLAAVDGGLFESPAKTFFNKLLEDLCNDAREELAALIFLGRGDYSTYEESLSHAKTLDIHINYLRGKPLWKYLPAAVAKL